MPSAGISPPEEEEYSAIGGGRWFFLFQIIW
jgi:hypothetical protein